MQAALQAVNRFVRSEDGPTTVEYAVMLAFIIVVCIAILTSLGGSVSSAFESANGAFS